MKYPNQYQVNDNITTANYLNSLDIVHKSLLQLIEEPESNEPFVLFLNEIEKLTGATASAIYITPLSTPEFTLLKATTTDDDWTETVPLTILPKILPLDLASNRQKLSTHDDQLGHQFVCIQLHQGHQDYSVLILKMAGDNKMPAVTDPYLATPINRLASIVASVQLARLKLRHAQYKERSVIARELHDSLAQSLSYLKIQSSRLQSILTNSDIQQYSKAMEIDAMMQDLRSNLNVAYRHLRELIATFRLTMDGKNFAQALTDSVFEFSKRSAIAFDIDNRLPADILTVTEETQLLHIIRESLSNAVRHSQAKFVLISIHYHHSGKVTAMIEDDGIGLANISAVEKKFGIIIMQERAHAIGGSIRLTHSASGGVCVKVVFNARKYINAG